MVLKWLFLYPTLVIFSNDLFYFKTSIILQCDTTWLNDGTYASPHIWFRLLLFVSFIEFHEYISCIHMVYYVVAYMKDKGFKRIKTLRLQFLNDHRHTSININLIIDFLSNWKIVGIDLLPHTSKINWNRQERLHVISQSK